MIVGEAVRFQRLTPSNSDSEFEQSLSPLQEIDAIRHQGLVLPIALQEREEEAEAAEVVAAVVLVVEEHRVVVP